MDYMNIILAFALVFTDTAIGDNTKTHNKIIIDISQIIQNVNHRPPGNANTTRLNEALRKILEKGQENNFGTPSVLFYESEFSEGMVQQIQYLLDILQVHSSTKILVSIKVPTVTKFNNSSNDQLTISRLISILAQYSSTVAGISIKTLAGGNPSSHKRTTITVENIKSSLLKLKANTNLKVGYMLDWLNVNSFMADSNIKFADYLVVNIPLQKNDNIFVESFVAFQDKIKSVLNSTETQIKKLKFPVTSRKLYFKIGIKATLTVSSPAKRFSNGKLHNASDIDQKLLDMLKNQLEELNSFYGRRYDDLLTQYCYEWLANDRSGRNIIVSDNTYNNSQLSGTDKAMVIPNVTNILFKSNMPKNLQLKNYVGYVLEDIRSSGFNTILINGDTWQTLSESKNEYIFPCSKPMMCRPENVMYYNNEDYAFSLNTASEIQKLIEVNNMRLSTIIFSPKYRESNTTSWQDFFLEINKINSTLLERGVHVNVQKACIEVSDLFSRIDISSECDNTCASLDIIQLVGCNSIGFFSPIIFWQGVVRIQHNNNTNFVTNIMKRLDILLIARQLMRIRYSNDDLQVVLSIRMEHNTTAVDRTKFSLYCHPKDAIVYQFYEMLITWAKIHEFPVSFDPESNDNINPLVWQQLNTSNSGLIRTLMEYKPVFIRRRYSLSTIYQKDWTLGMYPCLKHPENLEDLRVTNFNNNFTGVTICMNLRNDNRVLTSEELKVILLFALGKFQAVEIILTEIRHMSILTQTFSDANIGAIFAQNNINGGKIYIQSNFTPEQKFQKTIIKIQQIGFQVHIHFPSENYLSPKITIENLLQGILQENCTDIVNMLIFDRKNDTLSTLQKYDYIVCETDSIPGNNQNKTFMQGYLETDLYLKMILQQYFPNLREVHFRLHPLFANITSNIRTREDITEMFFLADINNFAEGHKVHYFMLPALPRESTNESSFWTVQNYQSLTDVNDFQEKLAHVLIKSTWKPTVKFNATIATSTERGKSSTLKTTGIPAHTTSDGVIISAVTIKTEISSIVNQLKNVLGMSSDVFFIACGAIFIIILLITVLIALKIWRHYNFLSKKEVHDFFNGKLETLAKAARARKTSIKKARNVFNGLVYQKDCEISKSNFKFYKKAPIVGSSKYFNKFRAKSQSGKGNEVLVEICKKGCPKDRFKAWMSEVKMLCYVGNHNNIVAFLGCYTNEIRKGVLCVITEFCQEGSLQNYLKTLENLEDHDHLELIRFACEIAIGMEYISSQKIIHGDLRCKHVYLDCYKVCKVGNFGLSRKMIEYKALVKKRKREQLPWRWMPCEALQNLNFSVYSDVWSYGVTLWEIFTLGGVPYGTAEIFSQTHVASLLKGERLPCPKHASPEIFQNMQQCWSLDPDMRAEFAEFVTSLSAILSNSVKT